MLQSSQGDLDSFPHAAPAAMPLRLGVSPIFLNPLRITLNQFLPMHSIPVSFAKMPFDERTFDVPEWSFRDEP